MCDRLLAGDELHTASAGRAPGTALVACCFRVRRQKIANVVELTAGDRGEDIFAGQVRMLLEEPRGGFACDDVRVAAADVMIGARVEQETGDQFVSIVVGYAHFRRVLLEEGHNLRV